MSAEDCKLENDLCRCCHSEGAFISLVSSDGTMEKGEKIISYAEMIRNCLDIKLIPVDGPLCATAYTVCEVCIERLRDAHCFKQQVLKCEKLFLSMYSMEFMKEYTTEAEEEFFTLADSEEEGSIKIDIEKESSTKADNKKESSIIADMKEGSPNPVADTIEYDEELLSISSSEEEWPIIADIEEGDIFKKLLIDIKEQSTDPVVEKKEKQKPAKQTKNNVKKPAKKPAKKNMYRKSNAQRYKEREKGHLPSAQYIMPVGDSYKCTRCDKSFAQRRNALGHYRRVHLHLHKCEHCPQTFKTKEQKINHNLEEHNIDERFKCNACDKFFNRKVQVQQHLKSYHMMGEKFVCSICDYECYQKDYMKKHYVSHNAEKKFFCKYCKKSFARVSTLNSHERIHTGDKRKKCAECGQAFVQKASLNYHMMKYHPEVKF